jgi:hypothetical protein
MLTEGMLEHLIDFKKGILNKICLSIRVPFILGGKYLCYWYFPSWNYEK